MWSIGLTKRIIIPINDRKENLINKIADKIDTKKHNKA